MIESPNYPSPHHNHDNVCWELNAGPGNVTETFTLNMFTVTGWGKE